MSHGLSPRARASESRPVSASSNAAESEGLLEEANEREAELTFAWREAEAELRSQLAQASERAELTHQLLCEQVGRELHARGAARAYAPLASPGY